MAYATQQKNQRMLIVLGLFVMGMVGLAYASVPLYQLFCQVTGFGGTTQVSLEAPSSFVASAPKREVRFNAQVISDLAWRVDAPSELAVIRPGEEVMVSYRATNLSDEPISGVSTFNVTPNKIGAYFMKIECFCFTEQTLKAGESIDMPVIFYLDPEIDSDVNTKEVPEITLSYTFFPTEAGGNS